jgi:ubiquinone/menaquinone biosynthesis C-methylase UbiE
MTKLVNASPPHTPQVAPSSDDDRYALGYRQAELERLHRQADQLASDSARLFDEIGIAEGAHVLEIGCGPRGCLELLSTRVGSSGRVVGVEINADTVALAETFVAERGLSNVDVVAGDARSTGLRDGSFDVVTARLVLVNVPEPEQIISQAMALARPGGVVAFHEVDAAALMCDPPSDAWDTILSLFVAAGERNGNDCHFGRRLPRLLRQAGLTDLHVTPIVHTYLAGVPRRRLLVDFVDNVRARILALGLVTEPELDELREALIKHVDDPETVVFDGLYVQAWGRKAL